MKTDKANEILEPYESDITELSEMSIKELKDKIRDLADGNESFENVVFEIGCKELAKKYHQFQFEDLLIKNFELSSSL